MAATSIAQRRTRAGTAAACLAFACLALGATAAAAGDAPRITVVSSGVSESYDRAVAGLIATAESNASLAVAAGGSGPPVYFDFNAPLESVAGVETLASGERALLKAALDTYALHLALGGAPIRRHGVVQREDGMVYVGLDGLGGRWFATGRTAVAGLARLLAGPSDGEAAEPDALPCPLDPACLLRASPKSPDAYLPRGSSAVLELAGTGFSSRGEGPFALADPGLDVRETTLVAEDRIRLEVAVAETARLGTHRIEVFNVGSAFRGVASYALKVIASEAEIESITQGGAVTSAKAEAEPAGDDHGDAQAAASELARRASGRLERPGDRDVFRITLTEPGAVRIVSTGPSDVAASLRSADGKTLAGDDDGGAWYNFSLSASLEAGVYYLTVVHCCGGVGPYAVTLER